MGKNILMDQKWDRSLSKAEVFTPGLMSLVLNIQYIKHM